MSTLTDADDARGECCAKSPGDRAQDAVEDILLAACDAVEDGVAEAYGDDQGLVAALTTREIRDLIARAKAAPRG